MRLLVKPFAVERLSSVPNSLQDVLGEGKAGPISSRPFADYEKGNSPAQQIETAATAIEPNAATPSPSSSSLATSSLLPSSTPAILASLTLNPPTALAPSTIRFSSTAPSEPMTMSSPIPTATSSTLASSSTSSTASTTTFSSPLSSSSSLSVAFGELCDIVDRLHRLAEAEHQLKLARIEKLCNRVLNIPELCASILECLDDEYDLHDAVQAGGPFLATVKGSSALCKTLGFEYDDADKPLRLGVMFWDTMSCGHIRNYHCDCSYLASVDFIDRNDACRVPPMVVNMTGQKMPYEVRFFDEKDLVEGLDSRGVFLDMRIASRPSHVKIVIENSRHPNGLQDWQAPPCALQWTTAEIVLDNKNLRMYSIYRIAIALYKCASSIDEKMLRGEASNWDEETGTVSDPGWRAFFNESDLEAVVSDSPKYYWFWSRELLRPLWHGASYAEACGCFCSSNYHGLMPAPSQVLDE